MKNLIAFAAVALFLVACSTPTIAPSTAVPASTLAPTQAVPTSVPPTVPPPTNTPLTTSTTTAPAAAPTTSPTVVPGPTSTPAPTQPLVVTVHVKDFEWVPKSITIKPGTTVQWINDGPSKHQVATTDFANPGPNGYDGKVMEPGGTDQHTFPVPGKVSYFCGIHGDSMSAEIIVTE